MEKELRVKTNSLANNLPTLTSTNSDLTINIELESETVNVGVEATPLVDPNISQMELLEERRLKNSLEGIECELLANVSINSILEIDVDGNLYISDDKSQVENFEINPNAELEYTFT